MRLPHGGRGEPDRAIVGHVDATGPSGSRRAPSQESALRLVQPAPGDSGRPAAGAPDARTAPPRTDDVRIAPPRRDDTAEPGHPKAARRCGPTLLGPRVALLPLHPRHVPTLWRLHQTPEVSRWWGEPDEDFPWVQAPAVPMAVTLRGGGDAVRGFVQYAEETDPMYRHAGIDVFLDPAVHGRGLGREVVAVLATYLIDVLGHERLVIDPAVDNVRAIACYEAVGFRPVGVMRRYERLPDGTVRDGLLMDLLPEDLVRPG